MKSYKLIQKALFVVCSFALLSCSQEEDYTTPNIPNETGSFDISVIDAGINSNDPKSRAITDAEYRTTFVESDKIGLFAVKDGTVLESVKNVCLTYDGSKWTVAGGTTLPYTAEQADADYYVYYPYDENLTSSFDVSEADPFATIVSNWDLGDDLEGDNYTKKDLMTSALTKATGSGQKFSLSFTLTHRMALVVVQLPAVTYEFTNSIPNYTIPASGVSFDIDGTPVKPFYDATNAHYRLLVKPETAMVINGKFTNGGNKKYDVTLSNSDLTNGKYAYYTIDGGAAQPKSHELKIGDLFYADGSLVSVDEANPDLTGCIGIVYYVGSTMPSMLYADKYTTEQDVLLRDHPGCIHGLVVGLDEITNTFGPKEEIRGWYQKDFSSKDKYIDISGYEWDGSKTVGNAVDTRDQQLGYNNTCLISLYAEAKSKVADFTVLTELNTYNQNRPAPLSTSGWFLPSVQELRLMQMNNDLIKEISNYLTAAGGTGITLDAAEGYWPSTERNASNLCLVTFKDGASIGIGTGGAKDASRRYRFVLAF